MVGFRWCGKPPRFACPYDGYRPSLLARLPLKCKNEDGCRVVSSGITDPALSGPGHSPQFDGSQPMTYGRSMIGKGHLRKGFTLIELLVVISIISILAALLLPA